jgi:shikimate kinase
LAKRLQSVIDRPLLGGKEVENELSRLWADRENLYKDTCHFSVNTNQSTAEEVAINIYNQIN